MEGYWDLPWYLNEFLKSGNHRCMLPFPTNPGKCPKYDKVPNLQESFSYSCKQDHVIINHPYSVME